MDLPALAASQETVETLGGPPADQTNRGTGFPLSSFEEMPRRRTLASVIRVGSESLGQGHWHGRGRCQVVPARVSQAGGGQIDSEIMTITVISLAPMMIQLRGIAAPT